MSDILSKIIFVFISKKDIKNAFDIRLDNKNFLTEQKN